MILQPHPCARPLALLALITLPVLIGCDGGEMAATPEPERTPKAESTVGAGAIEASLDAAEQYFASADLPRARAILLRLIDRAPNEPRARELFAQTLLAEASEKREQGRQRASRQLMQEAYEHYRHATELRPADAGLHQSAGEVAQAAELFEMALQHFERADEINPGETKHGFFAAQVLLLQGKADRAETRLNRVLELSPDEPLVYASLANLYVERGEYEAALDWIREARRIDPRELSFRVIEAGIHRRSGDPRTAAELLMPLPAAERSRPMVADELGRSLEEIDEVEAAGEVWTLVFSANEHHEEAWRWAVHAGRARLAEGRRERARQWLREAQRRRPDHDRVLEFEAEFSRDNGDPGSAAKNDSSS